MPPEAMLSVIKLSKSKSQPKKRKGKYVTPSRPSIKMAAPDRLLMLPKMIRYLLHERMKSTPNSNKAICITRLSLNKSDFI
jgi:hypothetical protein